MAIVTDTGIRYGFRFLSEIRSRIRMACIWEAPLVLRDAAQNGAILVDEWETVHVITGSSVRQGINNTQHLRLNTETCISPNWIQLTRIHTTPDTRLISTHIIEPVSDTDFPVQVEWEGWISDNTILEQGHLIVDPFGVLYEVLSCYVPEGESYVRIRTRTILSNRQSDGIPRYQAPGNELDALYIHSIHMFGNRSHVQNVEQPSLADGTRATAELLTASLREHAQQQMRNDDFELSSLNEEPSQRQVALDNIIENLEVSLPTQRTVETLQTRDADGDMSGVLSPDTSLEDSVNELLARIDELSQRLTRAENVPLMLAETFKVKPGEKLIVRLPKGTSDREAHDVHHALTKLNIEVVVLSFDRLEITIITEEELKKYESIKGDRVQLDGFRRLDDIFTGDEPGTEES